jgi:hypothetical protein
MAKITSFVPVGVAYEGYGGVLSPVVLEAL